MTARFSSGLPSKAFEFEATLSEENGVTPSLKPLPPHNMPYNVTIDDISPLITFEGQWTAAFNISADPFIDRYSGTTFHTSRTNGAQASFQFNGTAVYIFGAKRDNHGNYTVQVDDEQPQGLNGHAPYLPDGTDGVYQVPIYARTELENRLHKVVLTNKGESDQPYVDIDFVTWTSNDTLYPNTTLDDSQFTYTPADAWGNTSDYVGDYYNGTQHLTDRGGARASLTFQGNGIYLYGGTLDNHGAFTVELDGHPPVAMNGSTNGYHYRVPLYYADGLGPGTHTLTVTNIDTQGKTLDIDYVDIVQPPTTSTPKPVVKNKVPIIIGVVCGIVAVLVLATATAWYFMRRKKYSSESVDLVDEEHKPYAAGPPAGYGPSSGPGWNSRSEPVNPVHTIAYTRPRANKSSTYIETARPVHQQPGGSLPAPVLGAHVGVTARFPNRKGHPPVVQNTRTRRERSDSEPRRARTRIPDRSQDWESSSSESDNETVGMLPPDYHQATQPIASPQRGQ